MTRNINKAGNLEAKIARLERWGNLVIRITALAFVVFAVSAIATYVFDVDFKTWPQFVVGISFIAFGLGLMVTVGMGNDLAKLDRQRNAAKLEGNVQE